MISRNNISYLPREIRGFDSHESMKLRLSVIELYDDVIVEKIERSICVKGNLETIDIC